MWRAEYTRQPQSHSESLGPGLSGASAMAAVSAARAAVSAAVVRS